jgi:cell fate (sporulation/competence/biofilm development) regulator YlbF (YheA/YmcA/DUF963 family)
MMINRKEFPMAKKSTNMYSAVKRLARQFAVLELRYKFAQEDGRKIDCDKIAKQAARVSERVQMLTATIAHTEKMAAIKEKEDKEKKDGMVQRNPHSG